MNEQTIDIPKGDAYPEGLGSVGDTGSLSYEVVAEDDQKCSIKITGVERSEEEPENGGEVLDAMMKKKMKPAKPYTAPTEEE